MSGKILGVIIVLSGLIAGAALYYLQIYGFYRELPAAQAGQIEMVSLTSNTPEPILFENLQAIDADSSPIRFRACFTTTASLAMLTETYAMVEAAVPRNAPGWFDCFDAPAIAAELEAGTALAFLGAKNIHYGVDRIVVVTEDGRGYVWHDLNACGEKAYDGTVIGEDCPPRPEAN